MTESREDQHLRPEDDKEADGGSEDQTQTPADFGAGVPTTEPGSGGFAGRDPKTDMPRVPTAPETQEDPQSHDAAPSDGEDAEAEAMESEKDD
jgi:hypothetical protein